MESVMRNLSGLRFARSALTGACILCIALSAPVLAQTGTIVGRVTDVRMNVPVAQATVEVDGTRLGASTGQDGRYRITGVSAGAHAVIARRIGYGAVRKPV